MNGQKDEKQRKCAFRRYSEEYRLNAAKMVIQRGDSPDRVAKGARLLRGISSQVG